MFLCTMLFSPKHILWTSFNLINVAVCYRFKWLYFIPFGGYTIPYQSSWTLGLFSDIHYNIWFCLSTSLHRSLFPSQNFYQWNLFKYIRIFFYTCSQIASQNCTLLFIVTIEEYFTTSIFFIFANELYVHLVL